MKKITIQHQSYLVPNWEEMGDICFNLSKKIIESHHEYDRIVALAKGGWTWARAISDYTGIHQIGSIQYEFYADIGKTNKTPKLKQPLPISVKHERILIVDDVADSGGTIMAAQDYLHKAGASVIHSAVLFTKPSSSIIPEYFAETTDAWIIFPHEIREMIELLSITWRKENLSDTDMRDNFKKLGLPQEQVDYYISRI